MEKFLFGAVYIIEKDYDLEEIKRDLWNMKEHGYSLITLWPIANPWLSKSSHDFVFEQTRLVLDLCEEYELQAILQLFGQNQSQEFMPDAALTKDMLAYSEAGRHISPNCFWANLNHPIVRAYLDNYFKEAILEFKDHPAVYGYDVFNEAHFYSDDSYTLRAYQKWLKEKYKSIDVLNNLWYRRYESFSQIQIDMRRSPYSVWSSLLPDVDYEKFRSENLTDICRFLYNTAKKYDDTHPIIIDGTSSQILYAEVTLRNNDEFATAYIPDVYGATFYPKSWGRNYRETPWKLSMYYSMPADAARKAGKPYIINELQTHTQSVLTPGSEVSPKELYDWILMCVFTGAYGMQLWRWRPFLHGYQSTGRGLTYMDGTPNARASITKEITQLINHNKDLFADFKVTKSNVKIAVSYSNRLFFDVLLKWEGSFWQDNVEGWYKLFWSKGIIPEFIDVEHLTEEDLSADMIVLPSILMLSKESTNRLGEYVEKGGTLIADTRLGVFNEYGEVPKEGIPGKALSELFGFKELDVSSGEAFRLKDKIIQCEFMSQYIQRDETVQVLSTMMDGSPAIIEHKYGLGNTLYLNSFIGLSMLKDLEQGVVDIVMDALHKKNANIITIRKSDSVHVSYIESTFKNAMLVINSSEEERSIEISNMKRGVELSNIMTNAIIKVEDCTKIIIPEDTTFILTWDKDDRGL